MKNSYITKDTTTPPPKRIMKSYNGIDQQLAKKSSKHIDYMDIAAEVAKKSLMTQKHGCIIVYKNEIISSAYNFTPPTTIMQDRSVHAEVNALKKVKQKSFLFKDCTMYIVRIGPNSLMNTLKYSKPCIKCTNYINLCNIKKVFYSTNYDSKINFDKPELFHNHCYIEKNYGSYKNPHYCLC